VDHIISGEEGEARFLAHREEIHHDQILCGLLILPLEKGRWQDLVAVEEPEKIKQSSVICLRNSPL
jgi:hypothetical protein